MMPSSVEKRAQRKTMADPVKTVAAKFGIRRRRLGICHHSGALLPAPLRLLQDLAAKNAGSSPALHRRNAFRKNSAPAAKPWIEINGQEQQEEEKKTAKPVPFVIEKQQRCSLTAVSQGLSIISTPAVVVLYVSDRRRRPSCHRRSQSEAIVVARRLGHRRLTYPVAPRGVRHESWRSRRFSNNPATSWIQPSGVKKMCSADGPRGYRICSNRWMKMPDRRPNSPVALFTD